jgi:hypothetical protein
MIDLPKCHVCSDQNVLFGDDKPAVEFMKTSELATGFHIAAWCHRCQRIVKTPVLGADGPKLHVPGHYFTPREKSVMRLLPKDDARRHCPVCGEQAVLENHHLAPREHFGVECERWPQIEICRTCHERWHRLMGRDIGDHRKKVANG